MGGNSSSSSFCSGSSWPGFFPLASFSFFFCSLTACRLAISMFLWGIWAKQMVWNYGSSGLWLKLLTFFQYTTEKGKKGHTLIWDLMLLNLKTLLGRSNSLKVLVDSGVFKSGQGTSTTWPLWHRTRSLFSVCVNHLKQIQSVEYIFHPIIVTKNWQRKEGHTWKWGDHSRACTGPGTQTNPIGLYFSPTTKKNTVQSELCRFKIKQTRNRSLNNHLNQHNQHVLILLNL